MIRIVAIFTLLLSGCYFTNEPIKSELINPPPIKQEEPQKPTLPVKDSTNEIVEKIANIGGNSTCAKTKWKDRGVGYNSYFRGIAVVYAKSVCNEDKDYVKLVMQERFKPESSYDKKDALSWYNSNYKALNLSNDSTSIDTLRHVYVLLIASGMQESSGKYCEGRDKAATNTDSETAEAGLFQTSYNSRGANKELVNLFEKYKKEKNCFKEVFAKNITCKDYNLKNWGTGQGEIFQELTKSCPSFAVEYHAIMLRYRRTHYGPINRKNAELVLACDEMLKQVEKEVSGKCNAFRDVVPSLGN